MKEEIIPGVWRVGGGTWFMKSVALSSVERDGNVFLVSLKGGYALADCATVAGMRAIETNVEEAAPGALAGAPGVSDLLLTHSHADHSESAALWRSWHGMKTHLCETGAEYLSRGDVTLMGADALPFQRRPFEVDHAVDDAEAFEIAGSAFTAIALPGHTPDSMIYMTEISDRNVAFSGDVCFGPADWDPNPGNIGRVWETYGSNLADYRDSLSRMLGLGIDVLLPGHGKSVIGADQVAENVKGALETIERFLVTPRIYAFGVPWRRE